MTFGSALDCPWSCQDKRQEPRKGLYIESSGVQAGLTEVLRVGRPDSLCFSKRDIKEQADSFPLGQRECAAFCRTPSHSPGLNPELPTAAPCPRFSMASTDALAAYVNVPTSSEAKEGPREQGSGWGRSTGSAHGPVTASNTESLH